MHYSKIKNEKTSKCNICGKHTKMTWDHVPPKFCFNSDKVEFNSFDQINENNYTYTISQNGIKFRTLCDNCNNNLLGSRYDTEYKKLVDILHNLYITKGEIGKDIEIKGIKLNKVSRAVVGHILAAKKEYTNTKMEEQLRKYFLNENELPPSNLNLLYYVYVYNTISIVRDFIADNLDDKDIYRIPKGLTSILNSFPLAFILIDDPDSVCGLNDLFEKCSSDIEEEISIKIDLFSYMFNDLKTWRNPFWPCNIGDNPDEASFVLMSECARKESIISKPRKLKPKYSDIEIEYSEK